MKSLPDAIGRLGVAAVAAALFGLTSAARASEDASLMTFSTEGPDCYADGTPVLDGEYYALVWQTVAAGDVRFTLTGEIAESNAAGVSVATNAAVVLRALPRAKDGRCQPTTFAVSTADLPKLAATGRLRLYLLDTRVYAGGVATVGGMRSVQASVPVTATCTVTTSSTSGAQIGDYAESLLPLGIGSPRITDIRVDGDSVTLTVADTFDGVNYTSDDPLSASSAATAAPVTGKTGIEVKLVIPRGEAQSGFYRVKRQ